MTELLGSTPSQTVGPYLAIVLPLCGVHLPLVKTMIAVTFIAGLVPLAGNVSILVQFNKQVNLQ